MSEMRVISPLRRWHVLAGLCQSIGAVRMVEVGCKDGQTTGFLLAELPELHIMAIDPWSDLANGAESYSDWNWQKIEAQFAERVGANAERCTMMRMRSVEAATHVADASLDLVFIDAAHDYENALCDIKTWWPKLRPGGYLTGHDYSHAFPGVHRAVAACFPLLRVAVMPDSVWAVEKDASVFRLAA